MRSLRRLWPYFRPEWHLLLLSGLQIGMAAGLGVASPQVIRWVIDGVLGEGLWHLLLPGAVAIVVLAALQGVLRFGQRYTMELVGQRVIYDLRSQLYQHLQSLSFGFFDKSQTGELMSRVTADVESLRHALGFGVVNGLMHFATLVGIIAAMVWMDPKLALVSLLFLPLLIFTVVRMAILIRPMFMDIQKQTASLSAFIQENISGVRVVRAFATEEDEISKFQTENQSFYTFNLRLIRLMALGGNFANFLTAIGAVAVLWYGGRQVMEGLLSIGTLIAFNAYIANLVQPVRMLGFIVTVLGRAGASTTRIFELLDTKSDVQDKPGATVMGRVKGAVTFERVSFRYEESEKVLDQVSLAVKPGQRVALLGMTGSGKSTLINLVPRFYDPTQGRVLIDGIDVSDVKLDSLRKNIAIVLQETFLFSTTLKENIAYGNPGATMTEIVAAAKAAQIHEFINSMPDKYETIVGERGVGLSGGQKQRVAIARALLVNSPILIMDESTSAVDSQTEHLIRTAMDRVMQDRTSFVIASRLTTVMNADLVVVLDDGKIVEMGVHADLIQNQGIYRKIYELQLKPAEELRAKRGVAV